MAFYSLSLDIVVSILVVLLAGGWDLRTGHIPNWLTYSGALAGLTLALWFGGLAGLGISLAGFAIAFIPSLVLFSLGVLGGGDVKLLAALGALVGYPVIFDILFYSIVAGSALALAVIIWQGRVLETLRGLGGLLQALFYPGLAKSVPTNDLHIPFGVAVAIGTLWALLLPAWRITALLPGG